MEYLCKNSKGEDPIHIHLWENSIQVKSPGRDLIFFYSNIEKVNLTKKTGGLYSLRFTTIDNRSLTVTNKYIQSTGHIEDKSPAYTMFARVLHMHLKEKSKAKISCRKVFYIPDWQKLAIVLLLFGISYLLDLMGLKFFHPAIHGVALSAIALLIIILSEKNKVTKNSTSQEIPSEFLPT